MANLKSITDLPVTESSEGLNLIVNDNGAAKQIAASAVGAQADWNIEDTSSPAYIVNKPEIPAAQVQADWAETDETSLAFVKNKPVEEWDLDIVITQVQDADGNNADPTYVVNSINTFENIKNKISNGIQPACKCQAKICTPTADTVAWMEIFDSMFCGWGQDGDEEGITFINYGVNVAPFIVLLSDGSFSYVGLDG